MTHFQTPAGPRLFLGLNIFWFDCQCHKTLHLPHWPQR